MGRSKSGIFVGWIICAWCSLLSGYSQSEPVSTPLALQQIINRELRGGEVHCYQLRLAAGECAVLELDVGEASVWWAAWIKKDTILAGSEFEKSARMWLVAEHAATYFLEISPNSPQSPARPYRLRIAEQRPATDADRNIFQAEVSHQQAVHRYAFDDTDSLRQAAEHCRAAATRWEAAGEVMRAAIAYNLMGLSFRRLEEIPAAWQAFEQALTRFRALGDHHQEINTLNNLAGMLLRVGEAQQVLDHYGQLSAAHLETVPAKQVGRIYVTIANAYRLLGDLTKARAFQELGLATIRRESEPDFYTRNFEAQALYELGQTCRDLGEAQQAFSYLQQAYEVARGDPGYFEWERRKIQKALGEVHFSRGEYQQAHRLYRQVLAEFQEFASPFFKAQIRNDLGAVALALGDNQAARHWYSEAQALSEASNINNVLVEATARVGLARVERLGRNFTAALAQVEQALPLIERQRARIISPDLRATFLATKREVYELEVDLLAQLAEQENSPARRAAAFAASERFRARSLLELISANIGQMVENTDLQLAARDRELRQKISLKADEQLRLPSKDITNERQARLNHELALLLAEHDRVALQIRQRHPRYAALADAQPLTLAEVQRQVLDDQTLLLEYALGTERSWLFAVTRTELHSFALPPRRNLEQAARALYQLMETRATPPALRSLTEAQRWRDAQQQQFQLVAQQLSRLLLAPVQHLLRNKRLLIVPDGALHYVPFAALPAPVGSSQLSVTSKGANRQLTTDNRQPLIVNHELLTLPSASTLAVLRSEMAHRVPARKTLAVFADPVYSLGDERVAIAPMSVRAADSARPAAAPHLERLPATRQEAEFISQWVPPGDRTMAYGFAVNYTTATNPELKDYRYLHFATHGLLNNVHPALSGLALSQVNAQGVAQHGYLRTLDVFNLKLNAELVVLSGCRTALGKEVSGEGLIGLSRSFMHAGARRVLASLWQVNDAATAELMQRFYQGLLGPQKLSPSAALRAAQMALWRDPRWRAPYYWAAFTLQGEW